ncbi:MAG: undecaprenyl diphosphate synthase family protein, partial [Candidatus Limnocylindria bacterium]
MAIIADGNRRWARERGLPVLAGHIQGIEAIRPIVRRARDAGVETLSVYT